MMKYQKYDNYDAINVDRIKDIPKDYDGVMGVPITFLERFNPEQFEILGFSLLDCKPIKENIPAGHTYDKGGNACYLADGTHHKRLYGRIFIKQRKVTSNTSQFR